MLAATVFAQENDNPQPDSLKRRDLAPVKEKVVPPLRISYFLAGKIGEAQPVQDSSLSAAFLQYDPARQGRTDYATLGNLGTPARALYFDLPGRQGFDVGLHQFDLYRLPLDSIRYHIANKTLSDLYFSQGSLQDNFIFKSKLSRNLGQRSNLSLDYRRIAHEGYYQNQKSRHTALAINAWFQGKKGRYTGLAAYLLNDMRQENNGGIANDSLFDKELFNNRFNIPVNTETAFTRQNESTFAYAQRFRLSNLAADSLHQTHRQFTISHEIYYKDFLYKFYDTKPAKDSSLYRHFQVDNRGVRHFVGGRAIGNHVQLFTYQPKGKDDLSAAQKDLLALGLRHTYYDFSEEPIDTIVHNLFLTAQMVYRFRESLELQAEGHLGLAGQAGDYRAHAQLRWQLPRIGTLRLHFTNELFSPSLVQSRFIVSQQTVWDKHFDKTFRTVLGGQYELPRWHTAIGLQSQFIHQYIYFDALGYPQQTGQGLGVLQLTASNALRFGWLNVESSLAFQQATNEAVLRLPLLVGKHSLYYQNKISKGKMLLRMGLDLRYTTRYKADAYNLLTGQFQLGTQELPFYPAADLFVAFKVQRLRGFVRIENAFDWALKTQFYTTPLHPMPDGALRFDTFRLGLAWVFEDELDTAKGK